MAGVLAVFQTEGQAQWCAETAEGFETDQVTLACPGANCGIGRGEAEAGGVDDQDRCSQLRGERRCLSLAGKRRVPPHRRRVQSADGQPDLLRVPAHERGFLQGKQTRVRDLRDAEARACHHVERGAMGVDGRVALQEERRQAIGPKGGVTVVRCER